jgi:Na+-transporting NADH:ubiquinone oxidoreductase subunit F
MLSLFSAVAVSVGVAAALAAVLATVLMAADAVIGDYGDLRLSINGSSRALIVRGGDSLLSTLKGQNIFIPSACGGRGSCGLCKVKIESGAGEISPTEAPWLSPEERASGIRLSCQVKVKRDMALYIPESLFSVRQYRTKVLSIRDLTYDIKEVTLGLVDPPEMSLVAGKFVQFVVPAYGSSPEPVYRAYSIASPPSQKGRIELEIRKVPNGICTTYVFTRLKVGDSVTINGPFGDFYLRDGDRDIIFIAGGSGMAPIRSILLDMAEKGLSRRATYFFGARTLRDLFLVDEMRDLEKRMPNFSFIPALSSPDPGDNWSGETGLVTEVLDRRLGDLSGHEAYLCGSPGMIDASVKVLRAKGMSEDRIFYDKFA